MKKHTPQEHTINAEGKSVGRLASDIIGVLRGKHIPSFERHLDRGDIVIVKNVGKMELTGKKREQKIYYRNTGYPGGIRTQRAGALMEQNPAQVLRHAVYGMLPSNKLREQIMKRLIIE